MICYKDMTFCSSLRCINYDCHRQITDEQRESAARLGLPIAWSNFEDGCPFFQEEKQE